MEVGKSEVSIVVAVLGLLIGALNHLKSRYNGTELTELKDELVKECSGLRDRVYALEIKVGPFWKVIEEQTLKGLKPNPDPTHVERDRLIDKYLSGSRLSREEARCLARGFMGINEGKESGNKGLAVLGLAVLAAKYSSEIEDMLRPE